MRNWIIAVSVGVLSITQSIAQDLGTAPAAGVPGAVAPTASTAATATTAATSATPSGPNLFSFLCPSAAQMQACKQKLCKCGVVQMFNQMLAPVSMLTGGMIGPGCQGPSQEALNQPATSAEGAAARIQQEEAGAAARRAAIRYLATANCQYYPEAEAALIASLRGDPVECVRIEAARAFVSGCCCTKKTIAALTLAVNGKTTDGFPSEHSECVKALAFLALKRCLATYKDVRTPVPPEQAPAPKKPAAKSPPATAAAPEVGPTPYYNFVTVNPVEGLVIDGRHAIAKGMNISRATMRQITGRNDLATIVVESVTGTPTQTVASPAIAVVATADPIEATPGPRRERRAGSVLELIRTSFRN
ncbi:MAG: hypothetical protein LC104_19650 [Bacteroidales bacterium]|nr:hypothetical protein [Bacteroidales bacterium]